MSELSIESSLRALAAAARRELEHLNYPPPCWVPETRGPDGQRALDVLIVGAGMCGQTAAFALLREGVRNLRVIDRSPRGLEGPWATFARMETLRSPKQLTGPDLGVPSLTYRAWHEARYGERGWNELYKILRLDWVAYLLWLRDVLDLPVENDTALLSLSFAGDFVRAEVAGKSGTETLFARKLVLALGRDGSGAPQWPRFASFKPEFAAAHDRVFHASDDIDFARFKGGQLGVLGVGASAFDNAGTALEAGVSSVLMFARRPYLPQVNKSKWASFPGFQRGYAALDDSMRWKFYSYIFQEQVPPPHESVLRCDRHPGFVLRFSEPWTDLIVDKSSVTVQTAQGTHRFDAVVVATGFDVNIAERCELTAFSGAIMIWADRIPAAQARDCPEAARYPYLGPGFELRERVPGTAPGLGNIHLFNWGSTMSHGALAGDIPGLGVGASRLAAAIVSDLFVADADRHFDALLAYDEPELAPTRYYIPLESRSKS